MVMTGNLSYVDSPMLEIHDYLLEEYALEMASSHVMEEQVWGLVGVHDLKLGI